MVCGVRCREVGEMNFQTRLLVVPALDRAVPFILVTSLVRGLMPSPDLVVGHGGVPGVPQVEGWGQGTVLTVCGSSGRGGGVLLLPGRG